MRIDRIRLQNFRAFEDLELQLEPQLTVLVGRNGAGKTAILEGLVVALGAWVHAFAVDQLSLPLSSTRTDAYPIPESAARLRTDVHAGVPAIVKCFPVNIEVHAEVFVDNAEKRSALRWTRELTAAGPTAIRSTRDLHGLARFGVDSSHPAMAPVVAYYGTSRLWKHRRTAVGARSAPQRRFAGYSGALDAGSDRRGFEHWMAWRETDRIQRLAKAADEGRPLTDVRSPELEAVSAAACGCLEGARRVYYSANYQDLRVDFDDGSTLPFDAISDGQRNLVALAADIARRAIQLNPQLGAEAPTKAVGVVLIDEVELHLHPAWQWRVLDDLMRVFPGIQFVVTTHSPEVMSAAPAGSVRLIDTDHRVHRVERTAGKDVNSILEDIFGVPARQKKIQDKLDELARRIDDGRTAEAKELLAELSGILGEDDAKVVGARWELSLAERGDAAD